VSAKNAYKKARKLAKKGQIALAVSCLEGSAQGSRDLTLHPTILTSLRALCPKEMTLKVTLSQFQNLPIWNQMKSLIVHGASGIGKTSLAKAMLPKALFVRHIDRLRDYDPEKHHGVIFDDMNFQGDPYTKKGAWPRESQIHLVDQDEDSDIHCRYACALLPEGTPRIFTTNLPPKDMLMTADEAIARRVVIWYMISVNKFEVE